MIEAYLIYIAGPFRGDKVANARRFREAAQEIIDAGHVPLNPIANFDGLEIDDDEAIQRDLHLLARCDGVYLLPGWFGSVGARREHLEAQCLGIPRAESLELLLLALETRAYSERAGAAVTGAAANHYRTRNGAAIQQPGEVEND